MQGCFCELQALRTSDNEVPEGKCLWDVVVQHHPPKGYAGLAHDSLHSTNNSKNP